MSFYLDAGKVKTSPKAVRRMSAIIILDVNYYFVNVSSF